MARIVVASNAAHDLPTEYLDTWTEKIVAKAKQFPGVEVFELKREKANKKELEELIKNKEPRLVILHGHGSHDSVLGYEREVLIKCDENAELLSGRIVHALACDSGKTLAPHCLKIGTLAYIGYKEEYKLATLGKTNSKEQLSDIIAAMFLDPAFEIIMALIEGASVDVAFARSQTLGKNNLSSLITNPASASSPLCAALYHNLTHQMFVGEGATVF